MSNKGKKKAQKATGVTVNRVNAAVEEFGNGLVRQLNKVATELWRNQIELLEGLRAAEYNLRTHYKILNDVAAELRELKCAGQEKESVALDHVVTKEVTINNTAVCQIDWTAYYQLVEEELKKLEEARAAAEELMAQSQQPEKARSEEEQEEQEESGIPEGATVFGS